METDTVKDMETVKRQMFERFRKSMEEFVEARCELNPDVIVIPDDHSLLFEAQNKRALDLLNDRCGLDLDSARVPQRFRVHPSSAPFITESLRTAGFVVAS